jgi:hypothetical protein
MAPPVVAAEATRHQIGNQIAAAVLDRHYMVKRRRLVGQLTFAVKADKAMIANHCSLAAATVGTCHPTQAIGFT